MKTFRILLTLFTLFTVKPVIGESEQMRLLYDTTLIQKQIIEIPINKRSDVRLNWYQKNKSNLVQVIPEDCPRMIKQESKLKVPRCRLPKPAIYILEITGNLEQFGLGLVRGASGADALIEVLSFGDLNLKSLSGAFSSASNLKRVPNTLPRTVTDLSNLFHHAKKFNQDLSNWDVSRVKSFSGMFSHAEAFNQPLNSWDMRNAKYIIGMFDGAKAFNQPLDQWDTRSVTSIKRVFEDTPSFDQNLSNWRLPNVRDMSRAFYGAQSFNNGSKPLDWSSATKVEDISSLFKDTKAFNQPIKLSTHNVTDTSGAFENATAFNQPLNDWDMRNVRRMSNMFSGAVNFNQDISNWELLSVEYMRDFSKNSGLSEENKPQITLWRDISIMFSKIWEWVTDILKYILMMIAYLFS